MNIISTGSNELDVEGVTVMTARPYKLPDVLKIMSLFADYLA